MLLLVGLVNLAAAAVGLAAGLSIFLCLFNALIAGLALGAAHVEFSDPL